MSVRKTLVTGLLAVGMSIPMFAFASPDLWTTNCSHHDSTVVTNGGLCSTILGSDGVTPPDCQPHKVSGDDVSKACAFNKSNCKAELHMTNDCSGPVISTIYFDVNSGVKSVSSPSDGYQINAPTGSFNVSISGGPSAIAKK